MKSVPARGGHRGVKVIVICVTNCPPGLRGDLSKWLSEVNTGVYIGKLSAKVRDELWHRVCDSIKNGQATMVYSTNNEQGFAFQTHNTTWIATDYEGITLMKKPLSVNEDAVNSNLLKQGFSRASKYRKGGAVSKSGTYSGYVVLDLETTGLDCDNDRIIEVGLLKIKDDVICDQFQCFVQCGKNIPEEVTKLTGITNETIETEGIKEETAFDKIQEFVGNDLMIGYNVQFDMNFIQRLGERAGKNMTIKKTRDVLQLVRRKIDDLENYQLKTVAEYFLLDTSNIHRALTDCALTYRIYLELNKI